MAQLYGTTLTMFSLEQAISRLQKLMMIVSLDQLLFRLALLVQALGQQPHKPNFDAWQGCQGHLIDCEHFI